jgi:flagellar operon protein (TIGR03826 family)
MPDVRNCKWCGKIFNYIGGMPVCPSCREKDEENFRKVKQYLYDYPGASISQISNELEVSVSRIKEYLRDGRLEIVGDSANMFLECERCGKSIKTGKYCDECEKELRTGLQSTADSMKDSSASDASRRRSEFKYRSK